MNTPSHTNLKRYRIGTLALIIFLVIRSSLVILTDQFPQGGLTLDSGDYIDLAGTIGEFGRYLDPDGSTDLRRPPAYPFFLALFRSGADIQQRGVSFVQLGLGAMMSLIVLWLFHRRGFTSAGYVAAWLIAVSPNINVWSLTIMSEVLFSFLLLIAFVLCILGFDQASMKKLYFAGVILGLATLTRPVGFILVILWVLVVVIASGRAKPSSTRISAGLMLLVGSATVLLPWMIRNAILHDTFAVSDIGSHTLESFNFAIVLSEAEGMSRNEATVLLGEVGGTWEQFRWILVRHPLDFFKSQLAGVGRVFWGTEITRWATVSGQQDWGGFGVFRYLREGAWGPALENVMGTFQKLPEISLLIIYLISIGHTLLLMLLAIGSLITIRRLEPEERNLVLLSTITALSLIFISGAAGQARFRVPAEPFLAVGAGFGWWQIVRRRNGRYPRSGEGFSEDPGMRSE